MTDLISDLTCAVVKYKPELKDAIITAAVNIDLTQYKDSMTPLISRDKEIV